MEHGLDQDDFIGIIGNTDIDGVMLLEGGNLLLDMVRGQGCVLGYEGHF